MMSRISLLTCFLLMIYVEAKTCTPSGCDTYSHSACNSSANILEVKYEKVKVSGCQDEYEKDSFVKPPSLKVSFTAPDTHTYTLVMVDPDAPRHDKDGPWLHWIAAKIPAEDLKACVTVDQLSTVVKSYAPPTPPDCEHRYFFLLYAEKKNFDMDLTGQESRGHFNFKEYVSKQKLCGPVASSSFITKPADKN